MNQLPSRPNLSPRSLFLPSFLPIRFFDTTFCLCLALSLSLTGWKTVPLYVASVIVLRSVLTRPRYVCTIFLYIGIVSLVSLIYFILSFIWMMGNIRFVYL